MIPAIVLAAGTSSRMGRPKALLPLPGGQCFLARIVATLHAAGVEEVVAVLGGDAAAIRAAIESGGPAVPGIRSHHVSSVSSVRVVENPNPARGQLSSLIVGLDALTTRGGEQETRPERVGPPAALVTIVDLPLVSPATVEQVIRAWRSSGAPIVRPARGGRHGHPVVFAASVFDELRAADPGLGARAVVRAHSAAILDVTVDDAGAFEDIDTPGDYERVVGLPFPIGR